MNGCGNDIRAQRDMRRHKGEPHLFRLCPQGLHSSPVEAKHIRHVRHADLGGKQIELKCVGVGKGRDFVRCPLAGCGEASRNAGIIGAFLGQHIFSGHGQRRLSRLQVWIGLERALNQSVERFRVKQDPPLSRNVLTSDKVLGFSTDNVRRAARSRKRTRCIATDCWRRRLFEVRSNRATGQKRRNGQRQQIYCVRLAGESHIVNRACA